MPRTNITIGPLRVEVYTHPLACKRRAVWGRLYADDVGIVSTSADGLAIMMTVYVATFESAGLVLSETSLETMLLRTLNRELQTSLLAIEAKD